MGNIGYLRQQVEAYNKRPLPATEKDIRGLINNEKERPINVPAEQVVEQLMGKTGEVVDKFQSGYTQFNRQLENLTAALRLEMTNQAAAMQKAAQAGEAAARAMQASANAVKLAGEKVREDLPTSVPVRGEVYGFTNEKSIVWTVVGCVLLGALLYWAAATLFGTTQVSKAAYEQLQAQNAALQVKNKQFDKEGVYYKKQIKQYRAKNPKTTDFPVYEPAE
jgi:uncharacterized protein YukE